MQQLILKYYKTLLTAFCFLTTQTALSQSGWNVIKATDISSTSYGQFNCIAARGDSIHLVFAPYNYGVLYYSLSTDHGKTWKTEVIDDSSQYASSLSFFPFAGEYHDTARYVDIHPSENSSTVKFENWRASLQLDKNGNPHVCYRAHYFNDNRAGWIRYAHRNNEGKWIKETVFEQTDIRGKFMLIGETAMTLDGNDGPHVVFGFLYKELTYAYKKNNQWMLKDIPQSDFGNYGLSITADKKNNIHIAQGHLEGRGKPYVHNTKDKGIEYYFTADKGKTWEANTISRDCWWETDIAVDTNCAPFVTWRSLSAGIFVAHKSGDSWITDNVSAVVHGGNPMLRADKENNHVYCASFSNYIWASGCELLFFGYAEGKGWQKEFITKDAMSPGSAAKPGLCFSEKELFVCASTKDLKQSIFFRKIPVRKKRKPVDFSHREPVEG